ncbi:alpha/beta hydrolase [Gracilimonas tropica]|uniref:alpha/beta hydrolase n=1 Tax=Gracilimonas tropica TaxID=454600 RepID=UPI0003A8CA18|nr:dienelactone hydrolase family protein [Gracilimonas tropica]
MPKKQISGEASFEIGVPFKLKEIGSRKVEKPLIIYLHGYNQNIRYFEKKMKPMMDLEAYHLFIQGPYPVYDSSRQKEFSKWGRAWYVYDGSQSLFLESLEKASSFLEKVIDQVRAEADVSRVCVFGYSMGGYLAGYFALSRSTMADEVIVAGGRIKIEVFDGKRDQAKHLNVLAVHGKNDTSVYPDPQRECIEVLASEGFNASFKLVNERHELTDAYLIESKKWLNNFGYVES